MIGKDRQNLNIKIDNSAIKQVAAFKYFGRTFTEDGRMGTEINFRCIKANQMIEQPAICYNIGNCLSP